MDEADSLPPLTFGLLHSPIALNGAIHQNLQVHAGVAKCMIVDGARTSRSNSDIRIVVLV